MADTGYRFAGRVAVVTGASRGIGRATALALAAKGCELVIIARPSEAFDQLVEELGARNATFHRFHCDLGDPAAIDELVRGMLIQFTHIDMLINCAGVGKFGPLDSLTADEARAPLLVPLQAAVSLSHGLLRLLAGHGRGNIINVVAPAAYFDLPYMSAYTASRAGLLSFTRALDEEQRSNGLRVKSVCPAWVDTEYIAHNDTDSGWLPRVADYFPVSSAAQAAQFIVDAVPGNKREFKPALLLRVCALSYRWLPRTSIATFRLFGLFQPPALNRSSTNREGGDRWTNWEESISLQPAVTLFPTSVDEVSRIVADVDHHPSPLRAAGSRHSTTHCGVTDGGTLMVMRRMDRIIAVDRQTLTVTVEAGALYIDVAHALQKYGLQFYVNVEIGNLTMGSAATTGTKDASMPGENGQVCSYCIGVKLVSADGTVMEIDETQPSLLHKVRSSYGLFGAVVETTFRVKEIKPMAVRHRSYTLDEFEQALPALRDNGESMMYYLYPFQNKLTVEFRRYLDHDVTTSRWLWPLRNLVWKTIAPIWGYLAITLIPDHRLRYALVDGFYTVVRLALGRILANERTVATDQIIRYPEHKGKSKYTFSIWAFPEQDIMPTMRAYYRFCRDYYRQHGFRCNMVNVGYRIARDQNPIFSYSYSGTVMTLDPVTTGEPGWDDFLQAYNRFCSEHDGVPLFNQTKWLTRDQVHKAFGARIGDFEATRRTLDPDDRFLNTYFRELLSDSNS